MFHFPAFPPHTLYIQMWVTPHNGCRVSPFGNPRITARLTAPRGLSQPPTSFIGSWCQDIHRVLFITCHKDARIHCVVLKEQPEASPLLRHLAPHTRVAGLNSEETLWFRSHTTHSACSLRTQQRTDNPNLTIHSPFHALTSSTRRCRPQVLLLLASIHIYEQSLLKTFAPASDPPTTLTSRRWVLLRKEVIQPHLPVRLPCYDFVPIASPTFDRSLPYGLGHGLRVLPTFVT